MADYGRYGSTTYETRNRERSDFDRGRTRDNDSIFSDWRNRDREREFRGSETGRGENRREFGDRDRNREYGRDRERDPDRERHFGYDDYNEGLAIDETSGLIASNKVEGTPVYGRTGERLGSIYNFMVDKITGKVKYAVMSYGGFLGMGQHYFPLPWDILDYDVREGGYHVNMTERDLERAPSFNRDNEPRFDRDYDRHVGRYYGTH